MHFRRIGFSSGTRVIMVYMDELPVLKRLMAHSHVMLRAAAVIELLLIQP